MKRFTIIASIALIGISSCKEQGTTEQKDVVTEGAMGRAPDFQKIRRKLADYLSELQRYRADGAFDSIEAVNESLMQYLKTEITDNAQLLDADIKGMDTLGMNILTSEDKKFRIYCWDTETGGTMRFFNAIFQYRAAERSKYVVANDISESEEGGTGVLYREMHTIETKTGSTYYLVLYRAIGSSKDVSDGIQAFSVENGTLNDSIKVFQTSKTTLNDISYYYDFHSNIDENTGDQKNVLHLSEDKQTLYVPVVNDKDEVTSKSLVYKFNGEKFVFDKNAR